MKRNQAKYGLTLESLLDVGLADTGKKPGDALDVLGEYFDELLRMQQYGLQRPIV